MTPQTTITSVVSIGRQHSAPSRSIDLEHWRLGASYQLVLCSVDGNNAGVSLLCPLDGVDGAPWSRKAPAPHVSGPCPSGHLCLATKSALPEACKLPAALSRPVRAQAICSEINGHSKLRPNRSISSRPLALPCRSPYSCPVLRLPREIIPPLQNSP